MQIKSTEDKKEIKAWQQEIYQTWKDKAFFISKYVLNLLASPLRCLLQEIIKQGKQ